MTETKPVRHELDDLAGGVLLTEAETAAALRLSHATLKAWRLRAPGTGPVSLKLNKSVRYRVSDVRAFRDRTARPAAVRAR